MIRRLNSISIDQLDGYSPFESFIVFWVHIEKTERKINQIDQRQSYSAKKTVKSS